MEDTTTTPATADQSAPTATPAGILSADTAGASPNDFAAAVKFVALAASTDDARMVLKTIRVERHRDAGLERTDGDNSADGVITLTATDSYRLHTADVTVGPELAALFATPILLPAKMVAAVAKLAGHRYCRFLKVTVGAADVVTGRAVTFSDLEQSVTITEQPGEYPNWRQLMLRPDQLKGADGPQGFNPKYLGDVCRGLGFVAADSAPMRAMGTGDGSPMRPGFFTASRDNVDATALLMPVRLP